MNVRFFGGTKEQYLAIPEHSMEALYFCADTKELFWGDILLTDGMRVVPTFDDMPNVTEAAEGVVYYVTETRNGYTLAPNRKTWLQTIYAPATSAYTVPESEIYNTVTTVGAVRDIEARIYGNIEERFASFEIENPIKAISFAGKELESIDGVYTIDRACARRALGIKVPEGMEDADVEFASPEMIDQKIADAVTKLATKEDISAVSDTLNAFENHLGFVSTGLDDKTVAETLDETFAKKAELTDALNELKVQAEAKDAEIISYVDSELDRVEGIISNINHFKTEIVADITKVTDIGVLYLIKDDNAVGIDKYNEYIVVDGKPILIGDTTTDLSNYYNKAEIAEVVRKIKVAIKELKAQFEVAADTQNVLADRVTTLENSTVTKESFNDYKHTVDLAVAGAIDASKAYTAEKLLDVQEDIDEVHRDVDAVHRDVDAVHKEIDALKDYIIENYVTRTELEEKHYITKLEADELVETKVQEVIKKELEELNSIAYGDFDV